MTPHEARISVLIPCFNAERYLGETLRCVLTQSQPPDEIVVVDDGSTDGSFELARSFSAPNVRVVRQANAGAAAARNHAFSLSTGSLIQYLDADDLISANKLEVQLERLREVGPDHIATCKWGRFTERAEDYRPDPHIERRDLPGLDWLVSAQADGLGMMFPALWLIPRSVVLKAGPWNESLTLADDTEFFTRLLLASEGVVFCEDATAYYRSGIPGSLSGRKSAEARQSSYRVQELCQAHLLQAEDSARVRRVVSLCWQQFAYACYPHHRPMAEQALENAAQLDPVKLDVPGGPTFRRVAKWIGWKAARRLQAAVHGRAV